MATTLIRKDRESADQLLVRFNRSSTRFVKATRRSRYRQTSVNNRLKKKTAAIIREKHRTESARTKFYE
ncbi:MAG: hypothetical protein PHO48_00405 [Candidatus Gracilibacteria bacterium]|jgi:hypothetical protein|nr:hypothetical protein [Candidatus Gracilibacteria bacterium]MDD5178726.1 hypothetical protein [Candidatus Gracilibacteria bacterium]